MNDNDDVKMQALRNVIIFILAVAALNLALESCHDRAVKQITVEQIGPVEPSPTPKRKLSK
jgi:hypothetical protein